MRHRRRYQRHASCVCCYHSSSISESTCLPLKQLITGWNRNCAILTLPALWDTIRVITVYHDDIKTPSTLYLRDSHTALVSRQSAYPIVTSSIYLIVFYASGCIDDAWGNCDLILLLCWSHNARFSNHSVGTSITRYSYLIASFPHNNTSRVQLTFQQLWLALESQEKRSSHIPFRSIFIQLQIAYVPVPPFFPTLYCCTSFPFYSTDSSRQIYDFEPNLAVVFFFGLSTCSPTLSLPSEPQEMVSPTRPFGVISAHDEELFFQNFHNPWSVRSAAAPTAEPCSRPPLRRVDCDNYSLILLQEPTLWRASTSAVPVAGLGGKAQSGKTVKKRCGENAQVSFEAVLM